MNVSYFTPLQHSGDRVRRMLFTPFRIEMWVTLGFAAFLSEWMTGGVGGGGTGGGWSGNARDLRPMVDHVRHWLQEPVVVGIILWLVGAAVAFAILLQWIGAHGKFVFLDDVVHERPAIREPWARCGRLANSLFLFRLICLLAGLVVIGGTLWLTAGRALAALFMERGEIWTLLAPVLGGLMLAGALGFVLWLVLFMLDAFVVPIMYRQDIGVTAAWRRFLPLLGQHFLAFAVFTVVMVALDAAILMLILTVGMMTCCVGFALMATPYLGQIVLLPLHVLMRSFGPEFLAQFGPEYDAFAALRRAPTAPPPGPGA